MGVAMRFSCAPSAALVLGIALVQPGLAADTLTIGAAKPFELARMARAAAPGLHIKLVDASGAPIDPVPVAVEYDSGATVKAQVTATGLSLPAADGRSVRSITLGGQTPQRFAIDAARGNFLVFRR